ncbi:hypothetical protein BJV78DRAFT_1219216 [Lactifluus subvellereus]|nr:hypothetical protein BJV78DRAFT_1219216 [Lactifluus subvellereus]
MKRLEAGRWETKKTAAKSDSGVSCKIDYTAGNASLRLGKVTVVVRYTKSCRFSFHTGSTLSKVDKFTANIQSSSPCHDIMMHDGHKINISSHHLGGCPLIIAPFGRRLAWPLHKDDTLFQSGRPTGLNIYFSLRS